MAGHFKGAFKTYRDEAYVNGDSDWPPSPSYFSEPQVSGFMRPVRFEGEVNNLEIMGEIPREIDGTFYRVMPEPQFPSFIPMDPWFNGDGTISAFRISNGHVDFKQRYVRTEKFVREAEARRSLLGKYRNRYTDLVEFQVRSTANTNIIYWHGKLLALKEDSPPYALDPDTLETIGLWDFDGQLPSLTFTAHPKFDPVTREMVCFGYEAKGDGTPDICYYTIDKQGHFTETVWIVSPVCAMIHDFAVTDNYVLFPVIPLVCDVDRMKAGGEHWQWDNDLPTYIGVLPRRNAKSSDVKWFRGPHGFPGHCANAYEDDRGHVVLHMAYAPDNIFFWWPDKNGKAPAPGEIQTNLVSWTIDYHSDKLDLGQPEYLVHDDMEFPRIDDRLAMTRHSKVFFNVMDKKSPTDFPFIAPRMGAGAPIYNSLGFFNLTTRVYQKYFAGPHKFCQEPVFIPRHSASVEGDGYLMALLNNYDEMCSELVILDTNDFTKEVALVKLPLRLRPGLHGNWVDRNDADGHPCNIHTI